MTAPFTDEIDHAIAVVNQRFDGIWEATPAMMGYARAVAKVVLAAERGEVEEISAKTAAKEPFRMPSSERHRFFHFEDYVAVCMRNVEHWLNTGTNLP